MCGLVGVFNKKQNGFTAEQQDVFHTLLSIDSLRGEDSTGVFLVKNNGELELAKEASVSGAFLQKPEWKSLKHAAWQNGSCLIGHNRKATKGSIKDENAHPFVVDDKIVLVHNGGVWGDHKKHADVDVDSHAIAHLINDHHLEKALGSFYGAYALIWYNVQEETVYLIRNKERPLWWMETDDSWIWSSEKIMLQFAAGRHGLKLRTPPTSIDEDHLQIFKLKNRTWEVSNSKIILERETPRYQYPGSQITNYPALDMSLEEQWACGYSNEQPVPVLDLPFTITTGSQSPLKTNAFEGEIAKNTNKITTNSEFHREVMPVYLPFGSVKARAFEYIEDGEGGYYLYLTPEDDPKVLVRHHFSKESKVTEERVMRIALNEFLMNVTIDSRCWKSYADVGSEPLKPSELGYTVLISTKATIMEGGGIKQVPNVKGLVNA